MSAERLPEPAVYRSLASVRPTNGHHIAHDLNGARVERYQLGQAIDASLDAIYVLAAVRNRRKRIVDFRVTDANPRGLRFIGASRRMLINKSAIKVLRAMHRLVLFQEYRHVLESGEAVENIVRVPPPWRYARWDGPKYLHRQVIRLGDGVLVTVRDVTKQKEAELALRELPRHISDAQDAERRRVARELHDGVSQLLLSARFRLDGARKTMGSGSGAAAQKHLGAARKILVNALDEVRRISHALRPCELDDVGLAGALDGLVARFRERTGFKVHFRPRATLRVSAVVAETLYRIAQEALTNIERHALAHRVWLTLEARGRALTMTIADDGHGIAPVALRRSTGLGLLHMSERAESVGGSLVVSNRASHGTVVAVEIPRPGQKSTKSAW